MQQVEIIVAYLSGALPGTQRQEFELRLAADAELQAAVSDYRTIMEGFKGMRQEAFQQEIALWLPEEEKAQLMAYAAGELDPTAAAALERRLADDPDLKQRLATYQPLLEGFKGIQHQQFSKEVESWAKALPDAKGEQRAKVVSMDSKKNSSRRYAIAAALSALVALALWVLNPFGGNDPYYTAFRQLNYIAPAPDALVRGSETALSAAARDLTAGNYAAAAEVLSAIPPDDELFVTARYLLGHSYYQMKNYPQAVTAFTQSLEPSVDQVYDLRNFNRDNAGWTRILAQLALLENATATELQQDLQYFLSAFLETADRSDTYYRKALELEKQLDRSE